MTVRKFTSSLKLPTLSLLLNTLIFALTLDILRGGASVWSILLIVAYAVYVYVTRMNSSIRIPALYGALIASAIIGVAAVPWGIGAGVVIAFFSVLFFLVVGVASLQFIHPKMALSVFFYLVLFAICVYASSYSIPVASILTPLVLYVVLYALTKEYVRFMQGAWNARLRVFSVGLSLLTAEVLWAGSLISIGFLNVAALTLVFFITFLDTMMQVYDGSLTKQVVYKNAALFGVCACALVVVPVLMG